jgi:hypothetical protein
MIPEIENSKNINFNIKTEETILEENKKIELQSDGLIKRNSHSHYYGYLVQNGSSSRFSLPEQFSPTSVYLKKSKSYGYGVFASRDYRIGDTIEETFVILLDTTETTVSDWVLNKFSHNWECDCDICKENGKTLFIAPGYIMMYNHSDSPNAHMMLEKPFRRVRMIALKDIKQDEEITCYYGQEYTKTLNRQNKLDKRNDISELHNGGSFTSNKPCGSKPTESIPEVIKGNNENIEFKTRSIT